ncbi:MAG: lipocalin family protein [Bacteroidales bacterium]|nr:lipocalin family protein [Bacteroidales bacterium]MCM1148393.1 lipocalin family protein [Bacteroidales bacterium]MCM1207140.1 lipocalin family protein [Bacillota bacterium]MCM1511373.1 lipocalin family protein [Clostridium sp.]
MRNILFGLAAVMLTGICACNNSKPAEKETAAVAEEKDSMIYGLSCDGTNDSVIVFLPFENGVDPIVYNIEVAKKTGKVIGQPQIGDWVGLKINPEDSTEATMVVDLDQLKGTWTFEVRPTWKDSAKMSRRALRRKLNEIPDSLKEAYLVPREYGFTLKRSSVASPVGYVMQKSSLEDDSPVEYPVVKHYTSWKCRNGRLILISAADVPGNVKSTDDNASKHTQAKEVYDTLDFIFMTNDSLVLQNSVKQRIAFHRKESAMAANAHAQKAADVTEKRVVK